MFAMILLCDHQRIVNIYIKYKTHMNISPSTVSIEGVSQNVVTRKIPHGNFEKLACINRLHINIYHIWIVKPSRSCHAGEIAFVFSVVIDDARHTIPRILDVIKVSPDVTTVGNSFIIWLKGGKK
jgi:hypothetical protein